jgi:hypothetical protein
VGGKEQEPSIGLQNGSERKKKTSKLKENLKAKANMAGNDFQRAPSLATGIKEKKDDASFGRTQSLDTNKALPMSVDALYNQVNTTRFRYFLCIKVNFASLSIKEDGIFHLPASSGTIVLQRHSCHKKRFLRRSCRLRRISDFCKPVQGRLVLRQCPLSAPGMFNPQFIARFPRNKARARLEIRVVPACILVGSHIHKCFQVQNSGYRDCNIFSSCVPMLLTDPINE